MASSVEAAPYRSTGLAHCVCVRVAWRGVAWRGRAEGVVEEGSRGERVRG